MNILSVFAVGVFAAYVAKSAKECLRETQQPKEFDHSKYPGSPMVHDVFFGMFNEHMDALCKGDRRGRYMEFNGQIITIKEKSR